MRIFRRLAPLVAGVVFLGSPAVAAPHRSTTQSRPPVHMTPLQPMHVVRMTPFVPPKPAVWAPVYAPGYFPYWQSFGAGALSLTGLGLSPGRCETALPQSLGDLGSAENSGGFAPVALETTSRFINSLDSMQLYASSQSSSVQAYCQPPAYDWSGINVGF